jgi:hypothetical protein
MKIQIPKTIEAAKAELGGIDALLTAKGWQRAAIVYAFTRNGQGERSDLTSAESRRGSLTISEFAALGIKGLTGRDTVRLYRDLWAEHGQPAGPGDSVELPDLPFPPTAQGTPHVLSDSASLEQKANTLTTLLEDAEVRARGVRKLKPAQREAVVDAVVDVIAEEAAVSSDDAEDRIDEATWGEAKERLDESDKYQALATSHKWSSWIVSWQRLRHDDFDRMIRHLTLEERDDVVRDIGEVRRWLDEVEGIVRQTPRLEKVSG